jgi:hypothetical protein
MIVITVNATFWAIVCYIIFTLFMWGWSATIEGMEGLGPILIWIVMSMMMGVTWFVYTFVRFA